MLVACAGSGGLHMQAAERNSMQACYSSTLLLQLLGLLRKLILTEQGVKSEKGRLACSPLWVEREIRRVCGAWARPRLSMYRFHLEHASFPLGHLVLKYQVHSHCLVESSSYQ